MRRMIFVGAAALLFTMTTIGVCSGAAVPKVTSSVPKALRIQIMNTLSSPNLRVADVNQFIKGDRKQSTAQSWDYQSPNRAESIPRRYVVSRQHFGFQVEIGNIFLDHYSFSQLDPGANVNPSPKIEFIGLRLPQGRVQWSIEQSQVFAPLIDALNGNRYVHTNSTYAFSSQSGIKGSVTVNGRRVVSAQITYLKSPCFGKATRYHESELFYGIEHFDKVVWPPSSSIQYPKSGKVIPTISNRCKKSI